MRTVHTRGLLESRLAALISGGAIGAILAIVVGLVRYPDRVGPVAYPAIATIGAVAGAGLGVLALAVKRYLRAAQITDVDPGSSPADR